jgi:GNAT superfamily N-acetyltransferase
MDEDTAHDMPIDDPLERPRRPRAGSAQPAGAPEGIAARAFALLARALQGDVDAAAERIVVDGAELFVTMVDRRLGGRAVVQLHAVEVGPPARGRGLGTHAVEALRAVVAGLGADLVVGPITNERFWSGRFAGLEPIDAGYVCLGGCFGDMASNAAALRDEDLAAIDGW